MIFNNARDLPATLSTALLSMRSLKFAADTQSYSSAIHVCPAKDDRRPDVMGERTQAVQTRAQSGLRRVAFWTSLVSAELSVSGLKFKLPTRCVRALPRTAASCRRQRGRLGKVERRQQEKSEHHGLHRCYRLSGWRKYQSTHQPSLGMIAGKCRLLPPLGRLVEDANSPSRSRPHDSILTSLHHTPSPNHTTDTANIV